MNRSSPISDGTNLYTLYNNSGFGGHWGQYCALNIATINIGISAVAVTTYGNVIFLIFVQSIERTLPCRNCICFGYFDWAQYLSCVVTYMMKCSWDELNVAENDSFFIRTFSIMYGRVKFYRRKLMYFWHWNNNSLQYYRLLCNILFFLSDQGKWIRLSQLLVMIRHCYIHQYQISKYIEISLNSLLLHIWSTRKHKDYKS